MPILSQLPESLTTSLAGAGALGAIIAILFIRDFVKEKRDFDRETIRENQRNEREQRRDMQMEKLTGAVHNLVRLSSIEVLSRTNVSERMQEEVRDFHRAASPTQGG